MYSLTTLSMWLWPISMEPDFTVNLPLMCPVMEVREKEARNKFVFMIVVLNFTV